MDLSNAALREAGAPRSEGRALLQRAAVIELFQTHKTWLLCSTERGGLFSLHKAKKCSHPVSEMSHDTGGWWWWWGGGL